MRRAAIGLALALAACRGSAGEAVRTPVTPSRPLPAKSAAPLAWAPPPPLRLAATRDGAIAVQGLGGRVVVTGDLAFAIEGEGGSLEGDPKLLAGLPMGPVEGALPWISALGGRWPDGAFLTLDMLDEGGATYTDPRVLHLEGGGWTVAMDRIARTPGAAADHDAFRYADFAAWTGDRVLALAVYDPTAPGAQPTVDDFRAARPRLDVLRGDAAVRPPELDPELCPDRLLALPSGEIFVFGQRCTSGAVFVQRFAAGASGGVVEPIAAPPCERGAHYVRALDARAPNDVWVAVELTCKDDESAYLSHFDGRAWSVVPLPAPALVSALSATPEGVLWVATDGEGGSLHRRWPDGRWDAAPLPHVDASHPEEVLEAKDVWAKSADDVWVVAGRYVDRGPGARSPRHDRHYEGSLVLHSREAKDVLALPSADEIRWARADAAQPDPATPACARPFLTIAKLPENAPAELDYAELRAAVNGHEDVEDVEYREVMWRGERWVGAVGAYATITKLRALLEEKLFGASPAAYCGFYPRVVRAFAIAQTGDLSPRALTPPSTAPAHAP